MATQGLDETIGLSSGGGACRRVCGAFWRICQISSWGERTGVKHGRECYVPSHMWLSAHCHLSQNSEVLVSVCVSKCLGGSDYVYLKSMWK